MCFCPPPPMFPKLFQGGGRFLTLQISVWFISAPSLPVLGEGLLPFPCLLSEMTKVFRHLLSWTVNFTLSLFFSILTDVVASFRLAVCRALDFLSFVRLQGAESSQPAQLFNRIYRLHNQIKVIRRKYGALGSYLANKLV